MPLYGGIEAGGTKFVCGVGTGPADLETVQFPTVDPQTTMAQALAFLGRRSPAAVGIASFGPVDLAAGRIANTPKPGWKDFDICGAARAALGVPIGFDTDVGGAALGEARWGAACGLTDFLYLTVGTGIGGGALVHGRVLHGLTHPEMGHIRVPHDPDTDPFPGVCPYHGDCLEGLASGPALEARWGVPASALAPEHPAWALEARYLALALNAWVCTLSPQRIVLGGGVMQQPHLFDLTRKELARLLNGYVAAPEVLPPQLGGRAGVLGALVLAEMAASAVQQEHA